MHGICWNGTQTACSTPWATATTPSPRPSSAGRRFKRRTDRGRAREPSRALRAGGADQPALPRAGVRAGAPHSVQRGFGDGAGRAAPLAERARRGRRAGRRSDRIRRGHAHELPLRAGIRCRCSSPSWTAIWPAIPRPTSTTSTARRRCARWWRAIPARWGSCPGPLTRPSCFRPSAAGARCPGRASPWAKPPTSATTWKREKFRNKRKRAPEKSGALELLEKCVS